MIRVYRTLVNLPNALMLTCCISHQFLLLEGVEIVNVNAMLTS